MKQLSLEDINLDMIPINVLQDVDKRIADWRAAGGKDSDAYIQNQLRYLKRVELMANNATDTLTYFLTGGNNKFICKAKKRIEA